MKVVVLSDHVVKAHHAGHSVVGVHESKMVLALNETPDAEVAHEWSGNHEMNG